MPHLALTIAGSDPSGGAGLQADLKTFHQHGVYGASVVTLLTVQNTQAVSDILFLAPDFITAQLNAVLTDIPPHAAKTGALGNAEIVRQVAAAARKFAFPLVVDPVLVSKHGHALVAPEAVAALRNDLLPMALLVTPNRHEAAALAEMPVESLADMERAAARIALCGPRNVLVKGALQDGAAVDVLWTAGQLRRFAAPHTDTPHTHGTGCAFSAAITARLARGDALPDAIAGAKAWITRAIQTNPHLGAGRGPVNLHADV